MKQSATLLFCCLPFLILAQASTFQSDLIGMLTFNQQTILSLAEAFPEDKYDWRPDEDVRSVREAFLHMASTNYFVLSQLGFELPAGVDIDAVEETTGKAAVVAAVRQSFDFAREKAAAVAPEELGAVVEFPFGEMNKRMALMLLLEHSGEHKGQLIAYARMNNITPPWSE